MRELSSPRASNSTRHQCRDCGPLLANRPPTSGVCLKPVVGINELPVGLFLRPGNCPLASLFVAQLVRGDTGHHALRQIDAHIEITHVICRARLGVPRLSGHDAVTSNAHAPRP